MKNNQLLNIEMTSNEIKILEVIKEASKKYGWVHEWKNILNDKLITEDIKLDKKEGIGVEYYKKLNAKINVVIAPCGASKTFQTIESEKAFGNYLPSAYVYFRTCLLHQAVNDVNFRRPTIYSCSKENNTKSRIDYVKSISKSPEKLYTNGDIANVITTLDQIVNIKIEHIKKYEYIVVDEFHLLSSDINYKGHVVDKFFKLLEVIIESTKTKLILISATPSKEMTVIVNMYKQHLKILNYEL